MPFKNCKFIDLTQTLTETSPTWSDETRLKRNVVKDYAQGCRVEGYTVFGIGTHMNSPSHFLPNTRTITDFRLDELIAPACVLDVRDKVAKDVDYVISALDIQNWETQHSAIPANTLFLACTGWSQYWTDQKCYSNFDKNGVRHFPGFGKDAAELLVARGIVGVGIDTLSLDPGADSNFFTHYTMFKNNKYQLENLTNLEYLPPTGAMVFALPAKIDKATEAPARVIAVLQK